MKTPDILLKTLLLTAFLCLCGPVSAQKAAAPEAIFNAHWIKQEYQPYRLMTRHYVIENGDTVSVERISCRCDVQVTDSLSKRYALKWQMYAFRVETDHHLSRQWVHSLGRFQLNYTTSPEGIINEVSDAAELDRAFDRSVDSFFKNYHGETLIEDRERLYALREHLETTLLSGVQQFHQAHGMGYTLGEVVSVPSEVELSLSHKAVPATVYKKLERLEDGVATLVTATVLDSVALQTAVRNYLVPALQVDTTARLTRPDFLLPSYRQENSGALMMHLPTGWPLFIFDCREITEKRRTEGDYMEIKMME